MSTIDELEKKLGILAKLKNNVLLRNKKEVSKQRAENGKKINEEISEVLTDNIHTEEDPTMKLMKYSMRDYEKWGELTKKRASHKNIAGDFGNLAKHTYNKEVKNLGALSVVGVESELNEKGQVMLKDDTEKVDMLAETLKNNASSRYKVRKMKGEKYVKKQEIGVHINQKNQLFNAKLAEQFK